MPKAGDSKGWWNGETRRADGCFVCRVVNMASELHMLELLPAYALGSLDEEETVRVSEHLARCPTCRTELQPYLAVADQLALAAREVVPPARVKQQLMRRIGRLRAATEPTLRSGWWQQLAGLFRRPARAWALTSLILIVALAASNIWIWQRLDRSGEGNKADGMQVVALAPTSAAPDATGRLVISMDGEYGTLVVDGLPALDAGHQYQLWLIRDGQRVSGGVFSVSQSGYAALEISAPEPLASYPSVGITVEPAGGSPGPTGEKVLGGSL
jgi:anti-sigma-K factor RskA